MERKKVLYCDKYPAPPDQQRMLAAVKVITDSLRLKFHVAQFFDLSPQIFETIESENQYRTVDALVSHAPANPDAFETLLPEELSQKQKFAAMYYESLDIIKRLRQTYPALPIIIYTGSYPDIAERDKYPGALNAKELILSAGANRVVFKSAKADWANDAKRIEKCLDSLLT